MALTIKTPNDRTVSRDGVTATVHWDPGMGAAWTARFQAAQAMLDEEILRRTDPYVPLDSGVLKSSAALASDIGGGELVWATPYAAAQYYNTAQTRAYDPLRGGMWFERMKADNMAALEAFARGAVGK
ncbi:MAG: minor capsid protein [Candidatus Onthomonas sp.]